MHTGFALGVGTEVAFNVIRHVSNGMIAERAFSIAFMTIV